MTKVPAAGPRECWMEAVMGSEQSSNSLDVPEGIGS